MKITFISTVFNEEKEIEKFLDSLLNQTKLPDEIIIVDGSSADKTVEKIKIYNLKFKKKEVELRIFTKKGNRSVGRNEAIKHALGDIIVCSDSGNILDKKWIESITEPFKLKDIDVVAGYYKGLARNIFQKCLIPYVLVMPDRIDSRNFLPATRSVAFTKSIWKKVGGFDEKYSHNEDYVFAKKLKKEGAKITFTKHAVVNWIPRNSFWKAFVMFFRFAFGDAESGIWRTSVLLLFARYFLALYFVFLSLLYRSPLPLVIIFISFIFYSIWSVKKNYKYVRSREAIMILPKLQLTADAAVLSGTIIGVLKLFRQFSYLSYIKQNKFIFFILLIYAFLMLWILRWGVPNQNHPFPYNMDEWHQLQAVANTFRYGTPNTFGSANGTMFHFLLSGFYLIPFMLVKIIDPFSLNIDNWIMREKVFEILRLQTLVFGVLSIFTLFKIAGIMKVSKNLAITFFVLTPIWLSLSNYFKYDIALIFWILLSTWFFLRFWKSPTSRNFILAAVPSALTLAVKVSAMPIFLIYVFSYFWFNPQWKKNIKSFIAGIGLFLSCLILFGLPDTIFGKGNITLYFWENVIHGPATTSNYNLGMHPLLYLFSRHYPMIFGHGFMFLFASAVVFWIINFFKKRGVRNVGKYKVDIFIFFSLTVFVISLIPLQVFGAANRSLVVLPFFVLIIALVLKKAFNLAKIRVLVVALVSLVIVLQALESYALLHTRIMKSPQETSSLWIEKNIAKGRVIGLENIPIYQNLPDILQREFYFNQYKVKQNNRYTYKIIDSNTKKLPSIVVITNDEIEFSFVKTSPKKDLAKRIRMEGYKKLALFSPDLAYYKIFNDLEDYYFFAWITGSPYNISVYVR